jgi:hypothetical protein
MPIHIEGAVAPSVAWGANVSQRNAPGAMSAMAFIVNPVNPKVGVILTSPVFSAMYSPYIFFISPLNPHALSQLHGLNCAEERDTRWAHRSSKMQRFDVPNYGFIWLYSAPET